MSAPEQKLMGQVRDILSRAMGIARSAQQGRAQKKAHQDYVTQVDLEVDRFLEAELGALIPNCPVLSEERDVLQHGNLTQYWIVDPIDGTLNLMAGLPFYGIAIALVDGDGPVLAAVGAIAQDQIYSAQRGGGAWLDGASLRLPQNPPDLIVLSTGVLDRLQSAGEAATWQALRRVGKIRNLGAQSLHLCGVARGSFAAVASVEARIWDEVAAGLILREAGGTWSSRADGENWSNPAGLMAIREQCSLGAHPQAVDEMAKALEGIFG